MMSDVPPSMVLACDAQEAAHGAVELVVDRRRTRTSPTGPRVE